LPWRFDIPLTLHVRTIGDPDAVAGAVLAAQQNVDSNVPLISTDTVRRHIRASLSPAWTAAVVFAGFGLLGLILTSVGIYGIVAYSVKQRTHEIGVRRTLGAQGLDILGMLTRQMMRPVLIGMVLGLGGAGAVSRFIISFLYRSTVADLLALFYVSIMMLAVTLLAIYAPARRALRIDPASALRYE
jgi:putative ABC transport system permease protein